VRENPGFCPPEARGTRVRVRLRCGALFEAPADGKDAPDWTLSAPARPSRKFDIEAFEVI
jgi:hypothetical protein